MSSHLFRRGGVWWARLVVPVQFRSAMGRREFIQSCRTHDLQIAKLVTSALVTGWRRQLLALKSVAMTTDVLKLIDKAPALTFGGYLSLDEAAASIGLERIQLLRISAQYDFKLHCRLVNVQGHILDENELDSDNSVSGGLLRVSQRTKEGLAVVKCRGVKLGNPTNLSEAQAKGRAANVAASVAFAKRMAPTIQALVCGGKSMNAIATQLNDMNVPTMRGGRWTAKAISRVLEAVRSGEARVTFS